MKVNTRIETTVGGKERRHQVSCSANICKRYTQKVSVVYYEAVFWRHTTCT